MTLTEFLLARIDEDEAVARRTIGRMEHVPPLTIGGVGNLGIVGYPVARALAEVRAKTIILSHAMTLMVTSHTREQDDAADGMLHALALPYADHPDYRDEWRR